MLTWGAKRFTFPESCVIMITSTQEGLKIGVYNGN